jgi:hypothetical protein
MLSAQRADRNDFPTLCFPTADLDIVIIKAMHDPYLVSGVTPL